MSRRLRFEAAELGNLTTAYSSISRVGVQQPALGQDKHPNPGRSGA
ncbi:hypothetical protein ACFQ05_21510 [Amycolatopsis umgeniensis]|uniref:Uncharacterized protein n=1 Tax=Amycolatopsis umgeniensis TaxID=336628 RepID=A0A841BFS4_9PSEU|nr:hypothetical protein [Amycolatopsis umgeniensis]MBB5858197.1 hypothetical protein [Amycolatopsis umgeniensis]